MGRSNQAVYELIQALRADPEILPLAEITKVHRQGHDLVVDAGHDTIVAVVTPRRAVNLDDLTGRERQVASLVAAGHTNRQIAVALSIALGTVKDHVHAVLTKSGFETRSQLIAAWYGGGPESHEAAENSSPGQG